MVPVEVTTLSERVRVYVYVKLSERVRVYVYGKLRKRVRLYGVRDTPSYA
jgi:hypothetical protein